MSHQNWLIKNTAQHQGRKLIITPENSDLKYLSYGRIILNQAIPTVAIETRNQEIALICIKGKGTVSYSGRDELIAPYDTVYIPIGGKINISTESELDLVECSAPATISTDYTFVRFNEVKTHPTLHVTAGKESYCRDMYTLIGEKIPASRLLAGVTFSHPGNWTSWPPHQHTETREEIYLYIQMPEPVYGVQFVYTDARNMEFAEIVHENDAVVIPKGYHPNVAVPGHSINFVWMMAGIREKEDRQGSPLVFEPGFAGRY